MYIWTDDHATHRISCARFARGLRAIAAANRLSRNTSNFIPHQGNAETENGYWALQPLGETTRNDTHGDDVKMTQTAMMVNYEKVCSVRSCQSTSSRIATPSKPGYLGL